MTVFVCQRCRREYTPDNYLGKHWVPDAGPEGDPHETSDMRDPRFGAYGWFPTCGQCYLCFCYDLFGGFLEPLDRSGPWETIATVMPCVTQEV